MYNSSAFQAALNIHTQSSSTGTAQASDSTYS
jgi:hypothetical protein